MFCLREQLLFKKCFLSGIAITIMIITVPDPQQRQMGEAKGSGRGGGCSEAEKKGWHHTQVGWHRLAPYSGFSFLHFLLATAPAGARERRRRRQRGRWWCEGGTNQIQTMVLTKTMLLINIQFIRVIFRR